MPQPAGGVVVAVGHPGAIAPVTWAATVTADTAMVAEVMDTDPVVATQVTVTDPTRLPAIRASVPTPRMADMSLLPRTRLRWSIPRRWSTLPPSCTALPPRMNTAPMPQCRSAIPHRSRLPSRLRTVHLSITDMLRSTGNGVDRGSLI